LLIKRVRQIHNGGIELIGDNKELSIDSRHFGLIKPEHILGVVERIISQ